MYGDTPNRLPLLEQAHRWEIDPQHTYAGGIREDMSIDSTLHSLFGASKVAGRCAGAGVWPLPRPIHRLLPRWLPDRSQPFGTQLHGFLAYLMKCRLRAPLHRVWLQGKQVRDNIHSSDLIRAFDHFFPRPAPGGGVQHRRRAL